MSTFSNFAKLALRILVNMSAMGSEQLIFLSLPTGFGYAGKFAFAGQFPEADPAHLELAQVAARPAADAAAVDLAGHELGLLQGLVDHRFSCH
jgi:hypothetical protein